MSMTNTATNIGPTLENGNAYVEVDGQRYWLADHPAHGAVWLVDPEGWAMGFDTVADLQATLPCVPPKPTNMETT